MPLTSKQIERYSRQIIVPGMSGRAQERLLRSRMVICGEASDLDAVLSYMVGAGVGHIGLAPGAETQPIDALVESMRTLNRDVTVAELNDSSTPPDLGLAIISGGKSLSIAAPIVARFRRAGWVIARLDDTPRVAVLPSKSPCPRCASGDLLTPFGERADTAEPVAMIAAAEALKLLAGYGENPPPVLIEFDGYAARSRAIASDPACDCGRKGA